MKKNKETTKKRRTKIFKRDDYTCQECGKIGNKLNAHHIKEIVNYPELILKINNGVTLCEECHKKTESYLNNQGRNQYVTA